VPPYRIGRPDDTRIRNLDGVRVFALALAEALEPIVETVTQKDGYLATNSLLMDATLVARAYGELDDNNNEMPDAVEELCLGEISIDDWLASAAEFIAKTVKRQGLIVTFSPLLKAVAADLESKLAESALLHCQMADLRSFAHGRHLWLAERPDDCAILALIEPSLEKLWAGMSALLPTDVPILTMPCGGARPCDLLAGLVAQMRLVSAIAVHKGRDPGHPIVGQGVHLAGVLVERSWTSPRVGCWWLASWWLRLVCNRRARVAIGWYCGAGSSAWSWRSFTLVQR
jgi:hypothetical protein